MKNVAVVAAPTALLVIIGVSLAFSVGPYESFVLGVWAVYALAGIGMLFPVGWLGEISVGHAAIMAVGAYTALRFADGDLVLGLVVGTFAGLIVGLIMGLSSLRLSGFGLAIATLVFGEFVRIIIGLLPGLGGISGTFVQSPSFAGEPLEQRAVVALAVVFVGIGLAVAMIIRRSSVGRGLRAVRDNEVAARAFGIDPKQMRILAFGLSGLFGGAAGVLFAWLTKYAAPDNFNIWLSIFLLAGVVIGGRDEVFGPIVGAGFIVVGAELLRFAGTTQAIIFGALLFLTAWLLPGGVVHVPAEAIRRIARVRTRAESGTASILDTDMEKD